jgi:hypothetical protein
LPTRAGRAAAARCTRSCWGCWQARFAGERAWLTVADARGLASRGLVLAAGAPCASSSHALGCAVATDRALHALLHWGRFVPIRAGLCTSSVNDWSCAITTVSWAISVTTTVACRDESWVRARENVVGQLSPSTTAKVAHCTEGEAAPLQAAECWEWAPHVACIVESKINNALPRRPEPWGEWPRHFAATNSEGQDVAPCSNTWRKCESDHVKSGNTACGPGRKGHAQGCE